MNYKYNLGLLIRERSYFVTTFASLMKAQLIKLVKLVKIVIDTTVLTA